MATPSLSLVDALEELSHRAAQFAVNLNDDIDKDQTMRPVRGGNALVYQGNLRRSGTRVAIKVMRSGPPTEPDGIRSVLREVYIWSKLRHENVLPLLGIATKFDYTVSIVSAWMAPGNARNYVQRQEVDPRPLIVDIARGLEYLHGYRSGVYHGDLKGLNVLVSSDGRALLTDFGLSHLVKSSFSFTAETPLGGTLNWMPPENLNCCYPTAEGDVWSFGMTALELFTRSMPFHTIKGLSGLVIRISKGPPDRPTDAETCSRMTDDWWNICQSCWNYEPSLRPPISTILRMIEQFKLPPPLPRVTETQPFVAQSGSNADTVRGTAPSSDTITANGMRN